MKISSYIKSKVKISEVFRIYSPIVGVGNQKFGHCTKHRDVTASVSIRDNKGSYKCFSCGAHGDAIQLVMDMEGLDYMGSLKFLIEEFNIPAPERMYRDNKRERIKQLENAGDLNGAMSELMKT
jgi:DNA primase